MTPADKVSCAPYEAAVRECRLIRTGTVRITVDEPTQTNTLTLIVASSSPGPAPACVPQGETYVLDVWEYGMQPPAVCLKLGAVLRFENHGPDNFSFEPSGAVSCFSEAGDLKCRFTKAGIATFTFTFTTPGPEQRTLTVVAIK